MVHSANLELCQLEAAWIVYLMLAGVVLAATYRSVTAARNTTMTASALQLLADSVHDVPACMKGRVMLPRCCAVAVAVPQLQESVCTQDMMQRHAQQQCLAA